MRRPALAAFLAVLVTTSGGCVYYNTLYNARERFDEGERARRTGAPDSARILYAQAVEKAARGFREDPDGRWADDALYLMGRAWFRTGEWGRAVQAFEAARERTDDPQLHRGATLYLGATRALLGEEMLALRLLNDALRDLSPGELAAEGHFWRGVLNLRLGRPDQGMWDLARAVEADPALRVPALVQRAAYGVSAGDTAMVHLAVRGLAATPGGAARADTLDLLMTRLQREAGPGVAAAMLGPLRDATWPPGPLEGLLLRRARLLAAAGDTAAAETEAGWLAEGAGPRSTEARLAWARWRLARVAEVHELDGVRDLLLPAGGADAVVRLAEAIRTVELLDRWGREGDDLAFFAAGEVARDELGALRLARAFFLRQIADHPESPWVAKAMLAVLATTPDPRGDPALVRGLEVRTWDPYVASARTGTVGARRVEQLESQLALRLAHLRERAAAEVRRRDVFLRGADTLSVPPSTLPAPRHPPVP